MKGKLAKLGHDIWKARTVYLLILPVVIYMLLFKYWPMYWLKISLYDYKIYKGFDGSKFVGFANFIKLFKAKDFWQMIRNVVMLNFWSLIFCFPAPIILAIMLNELRLYKVKKSTDDYIPATFYFHGSFRGTGDSISFTVNRNHWIYHEILRDGANLAYG